jgi:hypothetical protein
MGVNIDFNNLIINYKRLQRHYDINLKSYDEIALLDLSHVLRIWMEMAESVQSYLIYCDKDKIVRFPSYSLSKKLAKYIAGKEHIIAGTCGGVITSSANENLILVPEKPTDSILKSFNFMIQTDGRIQIADIAIVHDKNEGPEVHTLIKNGFIINRSYYGHWLNCEIVRISYKADSGIVERRIIPRHILVKRVANILGGSHAVSDTFSGNYFDIAVRKLLDTRFGGLPVPYFLILKTAQDILSGIHLTD